MTDIPEVREAVARAIAQHDAREQGAPFPVRVIDEDRAVADAALCALRAAGYEVRRADQIAALEDLATSAADILPLVHEWFDTSEAERAAQGIDWECRVHMGVLSVMYDAQALAPPAAGIRSELARHQLPDGEAKPAAEAE